MSSISINSSGNSTGTAPDPTEFRQDFMNLVRSLQSGNQDAAETAFAAVKLGFQESPSTIKMTRNPNTKRTPLRIPRCG